MLPISRAPEALAADHERATPTRGFADDGQLGRMQTRATNVLNAAIRWMSRGHMPGSTAEADLARLRESVRVAGAVLWEYDSATDALTVVEAGDDDGVRPSAGRVERRRTPPARSGIPTTRRSAATPSPAS